MILAVLGMLCQTAYSQNKTQRSTTQKRTTVTRTQNSSASTVPVGKGDLPLFDLHGAVKSVTMETDFMGTTETYFFNRNGKLTSAAGETINPSRGIRDLLGDTWNFEFQKNGRLKSAQTCGTQACTTFTYTYNQKGEAIKEVDKTVGTQGNETTVYNITILNRDSHGNWIKRKFTGGGRTTTETRTITYYQ